MQKYVKNCLIYTPSNTSIDILLPTHPVL